METFIDILADYHNCDLNTPQSFSCAAFGNMDENVTFTGDGDFTIVGDKELYCTGNAVLCPGEINYYFTDGLFLLLQ